MWVHIEDICEFNPLASIEGQDIQFGNWVLDLEDIEKNTGILLNKKLKIEDNIRSQKNSFDKGYVLYGKLRPYLNKVIIASDDGFCSTEILPIKTNNYLLNKFFQIYLMSPFFLDYAKNDSYGTKMPRLNISNFKLQVFPLPPLNEQKRIVAKLEELLPFIDEYDKKEQKLTALNQQFPEQLKKSILQSAIQGKLVEQDPNDEPASKLIKRIQAEKERLILEKKIKKPKVKSEIIVRDNLPYEMVNGVERCIAEEVPFEIPENWVWVRLGDIGTTNIGLTYKPTDISPTGTIVLRSGNIQNDKLNLNSDVIRVDIEIPESKKCYKGDILICARNGSKRLVGKTALINNNGYTFGAFMAVFRSSMNPYIYYYLLSPLFRNDFEGVSTTTINQITQDNLNNRLIPLPPLNEQKRIIQKIEELFSYIQIL